MILRGNSGNEVSLNTNLNDTYMSDTTISKKRNTLNVLTDLKSQESQDYHSEKAKFDALLASQNDADIKSELSETFVEEEDLPELTLSQDATYENLLKDLYAQDSFSACTLECFARKTENDASFIHDDIDQSLKVSVNYQETDTISNDSSED